MKNTSPNEISSPLINISPKSLISEEPKPDAAPISIVLPSPKAAFPPADNPNPISPEIIPAIAPENAPFSKPSQNEPPVTAEIIPPKRPTMPVPNNAPNAIAPNIPPTPVATKITAAITITIVIAAFQCSLHHSPTFLQPSLNFYQRLFSHSGFM